MADQPDKDVLARDVRFLAGVGPKRAEVLSRLGVRTVADAIWHLPRDYEDRRHASPIRKLRAGESAVVSGTILSAKWRPQRSRYRGILDVTIEDDSGTIALTWFNAQPSWEANYHTGERLTAYGAVDFYGGLRMVAPATTKADLTEESAEFGRILPLYPMTEGMTQRIMRQVTAAALEAGVAQVPDVLPREFCRDRELPSIEKALRDVHFPADPKLADAARRRLAYEELFLFQTALALQRSALTKGGGVSFKIGPNVDRRIRRLFPFAFTPAQDRVIAEVAADMRSEHPMNRLLQGDVGCGKTVVAVYAMLAALAESSKRRQVALMAPTEILAEQHFLTLDSLLERARVRPALLTSGVVGAERERVLGGLARGEVDMVVGTHALIQEHVRVPQPLARRGGRAAPLRRAPAAGPAREGAAAGRPHHDGHAHPAHARAGLLRATWT